MDLDAYFDRIGYAGPHDATPEALAGIAMRHAMSIPFENIGVLVSGPPELDLDALEAKLVQRGRGGYCYEQNHLLLAALSATGFHVVPLSARVRYGLPSGTQTPRSHMVLCVLSREGRMLVDAGFGGLTLTGPVRIDTEDPQPTPHEHVRLVAGEEGFILQALVGNEWRDVYSFDFTRQLPVDYAQQNWHTATRPGALFANNLVAALPTPDGRDTLFNRTLTWRSRTGLAQRSTLDTAEALRGTLDTVFGIRVTDAELAKAWEVSGRGQAHHATFS
jgi:N-hydroxyarylamine O-acetyltransferase